MDTADLVGNHGQNVFAALIRDFYGRPRPYFFPHFLGDKFETQDFLVQLVDPGPVPCFFFAQVRTTRAGYTGKARNLKVTISGKQMQRLGQYPLPSYLVGVDESAKPWRGYIVSANDPTRGGLKSLPTRYPLDATNLPLLWNEVKGYWAGQTKGIIHSVFAI